MTEGGGKECFSNTQVKITDYADIGDDFYFRLLNSWVEYHPSDGTWIKSSQYGETFRGHLERKSDGSEKILKDSVIGDKSKIKKERVNLRDEASYQALGLIKGYYEINGFEWVDAFGAYAKTWYNYKGLVPEYMFLCDNGKEILNRV